MAGNYEAGELIATMALDVSDINSSASKVASIMSSMGSSMEAVSQKLSRLETAYSSGMASMKNAINSLAEAQEKANSAMLRKEQSMNTHLTSLGQAANATKTYSEKTKENTTAIKNSSSAIAKHSQAISGAAQSSAKALNTISKVHFGNVVAGLELVSETVESMAKRLSGANGNFERLARTIRSSIGTASAQASRDIASLAKAVASLDAVSRKGFGKLGSINTSQLKEAQKQTELLRKELEALRRAGSGFGSGGIGGGIGSIGNSFRRASSDGNGLMGVIRNLSIDFFFLQYAAKNLGSVFQLVFGQGISFAAEMENTLIGMGAIISSSMTMDGKDITFQQGMGLAQGAVKGLRDAALKTNLTLEELMGTFQAILGPSTQMGLSFEQTKEFAVFGATAVKSMGLRKDQLVQELRSIMTGNITDRNSTLATALGIKNSDIENAKTQVGGVFAFLQERMAGFVEAAKTSETTFTAIWSNITDGIQQTQAEGFAGLFDKIKKELALVQSLFFNVYKDAAGKDVVELNEDTVNKFRIVAAYAEVIYDDVKAWAIALLDNDNFMSRIYDTFNAISSLASYIYTNFSTIAEELALIYAVSGGWLRFISMLVVYFDGIPEAIALIKEYLDEILIGMAAWTVLSTLLDLLIFTSTGRFGELKYAVEAVSAALGIAGEVTVSTTAIMIARLGLVVAAVAAVTYALYQMHKAMENKQVQKQMMDENGVQNMTLFEQGGDSSNPNEDAADLKRENDNLLDKSERTVVESRYKAQNAVFAAQNAMNLMKDKLLEAKYPPSGGKAGKTPKGAAGDGQREALNEIGERYKMEKAIIKAALDDLEYLHRENLVAVEEYYDHKQALQEHNLNLEIAELKERMGLLTKESEIVKTQGEITLKEQERDRLAITNAREKAKAIRDLDKELNTYYTTILNNQGQGMLAATIEWDDKHFDIVRKLKAESDFYTKMQADGKVLTAEEVLRQEKVTAITAELNKQRADYVAMGNIAAAIQKYDVKRKGIDNTHLAESLKLQEQVKNGTLSEFEYKQKSYDLDTKKSAELQNQLDLLERQYNATGGDASKWQSVGGEGIFEDARKKILDLKKDILDLKHPLDYISETVLADFKDGMTDAFTDMIMGTESVAKAFQNMAKSILNSMAKIMANRLASNIVTRILGGLGGGGGGSTYDSMASKFGSVSWATGGQISGPGTSTSDSILSFLSDGEYVINAASVNKFGTPFFDALNGGRLPSLPQKYATGGSVSRSSSSSLEGSSSTSPIPMKIEIVNKTNTAAQVSSATSSFDGSSYIMSIVIDGISRNAMGSRDMIVALGKKG